MATNRTLLTLLVTPHLTWAQLRDYTATASERALVIAGRLILADRIGWQLLSDDYVTRLSAHKSAREVCGGINGLNTFIICNAGSETGVMKWVGEFHEYLKLRVSPHLGALLGLAQRYHAGQTVELSGKQFCFRYSPLSLQR